MAFESLIDGGGTLTEAFGPGGAYQPCAGSSNPGIDIAAPCGRITRAIGYGTVVSIGAPCWSGPHAVIIRSGPVDILYAHQSNHFVNPGQQVGPRTAVGAIGAMTGGPCCGVHQADPCAPSYNCGGTATGPHIHWQVAPAGTDFAAHYCVGIDPIPYLSSWPGAAPTPPPPPQPPPSPVQPPPAAGADASSLLPLLAIAAGGFLLYRSPKVRSYLHRR